MNSDLFISAAGSFSSSSFEFDIPKDVSHRAI